jgi:hypothetical protein
VPAPPNQRRTGTRRRTNGERRTEKGAAQNSTKSDRKQNETLPNFAQMKFNWTRTYPQKIITRDDSKLWKTQIVAMNEKLSPKTKITAQVRNENHRQE